MTIPPYAGSVIQNYRRMFREKYGRETRVSDEIIWNIFNTVFDDEDTKAQDKARLETMREREAD